MIEVDRVIVPIDGSQASERAIPIAEQATHHLGSKLTAVSIVEDSHEIGRRRAELEQLFPCAEDSGIEFEVLAHPHAPRALSDFVPPRGLVVMATSTRPLLHQGYIGSAAETVVRRTHLPTILVGPRISCGLDHVKSVVVPVDGSALSEAALPVARQWADLLGVGLWVVTVLPPEGPWRDQPEDAYVRRLATAIDGQWEVLHGDDPARSLALWARDAMIVMTSHGRSGFSRLTIGSITAATVRWASGPVAVLNPTPDTQQA